MDMVIKQTNSKTAVTFLSGSSGELDWILPILDFLLKKHFNIKIIFLTRHARYSVENNKFLFDFIRKKNSFIEIIFCGGYFWERIEKVSYLLHRLALKFSISKKVPFSFAYKILDAFFKKIFFFRLPTNLLDLKDDINIFLLEYPALRRPRNNWVRNFFAKSIFFYCPHSPHVYAEDLNIEYSKNESVDYEKKSYLLLGHPADYQMINDGKELSSPELEKLFIGHPKYSDGWLKDLRKKSLQSRKMAKFNDEVTVLVLSRGKGSYLDDDSYKYLVNKTVQSLKSTLPNFNLLIKKHPREMETDWDNLANDNDFISIKNDHILNLATQVDFVISFWSSGAMDCHTLGVPVIEFYDPNRNPKQQVYTESRDEFTTIYRKLGMVTPADNQEELQEEISRLRQSNFVISEEGIHSFYSDLLSRSNGWEEKIEKILEFNNLNFENHLSSKN